MHICDTASWALFAVFVILALVFTVIAVKIANKKHEAKKKAGYVFTRVDPEFTLKTSILYVLFAFGAAFFAALAGIGPGLVFNSLFVSMDKHPSVASATGMYMTLFTTLSATINVMINQKLKCFWRVW